MQSGFVRVHDVRFHYLAQGRKTNPLILFLHGFPEHSLAWREQLHDLSKSYYAVAIDLKGYNLSSKPKDLTAYKIDRVVEEIQSLSQKLSKQPFFLVGHDWGGVLAWEFAMKYPERLKATVIINSAHPILFFREYYKDSSQFAMSNYLRKTQSGEEDVSIFSAHDFAELQDRTFHDPVGRATAFFDSKTRAAYLKAWKEPEAFQSMLRYYRASEFPPKELFSSATPVETNPVFKGFHIDRVPVLVLWGVKDQTLSEKVLDGLDRFVAKLKIVRFPENTHWLVHENPSEVSHHIEDFFQLRK